MKKNLPVYPTEPTNQLKLKIIMMKKKKKEEIFYIRLCIKPILIIIKDIVLKI